jgi:hypothetical protein
VYEMADVEFDPWQEAEENMQAGERPGGMGTAAHGEAVRQVVEMFGGLENVPGYVALKYEENGTSEMDFTDRSMAWEEAGNSTPAGIQVNSLVRVNLVSERWV